MAGGGLATCQNGTFRATTRYSEAAAACTQEGDLAYGSIAAGQLICRHGQYANFAANIPEKLLVYTSTVKDGTFVSVEVTGDCPSVPNGQAFALAYLLPVNDVLNSTNPALNRQAEWNGNGWLVHLTDGQGNSTMSEALIEVYCQFKAL